LKSLIILVYILAFSVGTFTHWNDIASSGWTTCHECSIAANVYWLALAFVDPLAIVLILIRRTTGIRIMQIIMFTDVAVNLAVGISEFSTYGHWTMQGICFQVPFMAFLFATAPFVLKNGEMDSDVREARRWFKERLTSVSSRGCAAEKSRGPNPVKTKTAPKEISRPTIAQQRPWRITCSSKCSTFCSLGASPK
jgi:hypothetical protein